MKLQPPLTHLGQRGSNKCGADGGKCARTAIWHVRWRREGAVSRCTLLCDGHMASYTQDFVWLDSHPASARCDMPGVIWHSDGCNL